jgi:hypothetical protein
MDTFDIKQIWKGEYVYDDRFQPAAIKTSFPFILRIKSVGPDGLFEGMCQDDPAITQIDFHADIFGKLEGNELTFNKMYPKAILRDKLGQRTIIDQPHPDILYQGQIPNKRRILGTWKIERTFRKVGDNVIDIGSITGVWWMERF